MANLKITLRHGLVGSTERQRTTVKSLGLRRINQTVERTDTPVVRGQIAKVAHLVSVEEVN